MICVLVAFGCAEAQSPRLLDDPQRKCATEINDVIAKLKNTIRGKKWLHLQQDLSSDFVSSFGPDGGLEGFIKTWQPESAESKLWAALNLILARKPENNGDLSAPIIIFADQIDPNELRLGLICRRGQWKIKFIVAGD